MTDDEKEKWLEGAEYYGDAIENKALVPVMDAGDIDDTVSFPAVKYDKDPSLYPSAKPEGFRQVYFKSFWDRIDTAASEAEQAASDLDTLKTSTESARDGAIAATTAANEAAAAAIQAVEDMPDVATEEAVRNIVRNYEETE